MAHFVPANQRGQRPLAVRRGAVGEELRSLAGTDQVQYPQLKDHITRLRRGALGTYRQLLAEVMPSTPMQLYLTGVDSSKDHPNENLARELAELFALGVTHPRTGQKNYTETDVKEMARALTGYRFNWLTGQAYFDPRAWDPGTKTFLGAPRGAAQVAEVLAAVTGHSSFAYFVPRRFYQEIVGLDPSPAVLDTLAQAWGSTGDLRALVRAIALRPEFLSDAAIGARVKCPVELVVGAMRVLGITNSERLYLDWQLHEMSQDLFRTPNVNGWPSGAEWLHAGHLIGWSRTLQSLCWSDNGSSTVPVANQSPTIRYLFATGSSETGGDLALQLAGLYDVSPETRAAVRDYATGGNWTFHRACGLMNLALASPEYLVN